MKEIRKKYKEGYYDVKYDKTKFRKYPDHVLLDENQSAGWNRNEISRRNKIADELWYEYRRKVEEKDKEFHHDVISYIMKEYSLPAYAALIIERFVYDKFCPNMEEYFTNIDHFSQVVNEVLYVVKPDS